VVAGDEANWSPFWESVYLALMRLTYPIGWCVSHVVLALIYMFGRETVWS
jgi:hypothetical protein